MGKALAKSKSLNENDEIDLFELFETLWNSRILIVSITLVTLSIGLLFDQIREQPKPEYKISTQAHQKNDLTTSIILSKLWVNSTEEELRYFATQGMSKYQLGNNPYSPNALFIRALEKINSLEEKVLYLKENKMGLDFKITFPGRISDIFEISTTTHNKTEIENLKNETKKYIEWSIKRFDQSLLQEAKLLNSNFHGGNLSAPFYISQMDQEIIVINKSNTKLVTLLTILLGLVMGSIVALIRNAIRTHYSKYQRL